MASTNFPVNTQNKCLGRQIVYKVKLGRIFKRLKKNAEILPYF